MSSQILFIIGFLIGCIFIIGLIFVHLIIPEIIKSKYLTFEKITLSYYKVSFKNKTIAYLFQDNSGYFYCDFESKGSYSKETLEEIVNELEKLNRPINESLNNYFKNQITV